jgi:hypothetical protein
LIAPLEKFQKFSYREDKIDLWDGGKEICITKIENFHEETCGVIFEPFSQI